MEKKHKKQSWIKRLTAKITNKLIGMAFILFAIIMIGILFQLLELFYGFSVINWFKDLPYIYPLTVHIFNEIEALTERGIFYIYAFGGLFIFPIPNEMIYLRLLKKFSFEFLLPIIYIGLFIAHNINYLIGRTFGFILKYLFSKSSINKINNYLKKYGAPTIIIFNALPLPSPFFNFCCGVFKYKYIKWVLTAIPGQIINYIIITAIYIQFLA
ncbi:VTT domain-containing protein [Candidatus Woesearchaeota archaeon]|nr:VTT domain-containing protein [Candidatus Woesearchaeota archaeon]